MKNEHHKKSYENLKIKFSNHETIDEFYSQAAQDLFVLSVLNGKTNGIFLDIGCNDPKIISNTFLLENKFNWTGVLIDIDQNYIDMCTKERSSNVICEDATKINYDDVFSKYQNIDYMSLDIDGIPTLEVLKKLPLDKFKIKVITFEHDSYRVGGHIRDVSREIFDQHGYYRICQDVANENNVYEDWYVHPDLIDVSSIEVLKCNNKNWDEILFY